MTEIPQNPPTPEPEPGRGSGSTETPGTGPSPTETPGTGPSPTETPGPTSTQAPPASSAPSYSDFRTRYVRPKEGRMIAGVCVAIARATNTDPVLWRVLFAVLTLFGGIGLIAYLAGWLFFREEGDTASPIEALFGQGQSSTSTTWAIILSIGLLLSSIVLVSSTNVPVALVLGALILGIVLLAYRRDNSGGMGAPPLAPAGPAPGYGPPTSGYRSPAGYDSPTPPAGAPFAPHGPYAMAGTGQVGTTQMPPMPPTPMPHLPPPPPKPPKERSLLGRYTFFSALISIAIVAMIDLIGVSVAVPAYFAVPLAVVGIGLLVGTRFGRAYWLIAPGVVLAIALGFATAIDADNRNNARDERRAASVPTLWNPQTVSGIQPEYRIRLDQNTVDFSGVDFTEQTAKTTIRCNFCDVTVKLPTTVDAEVNLIEARGGVEIFGINRDGSEPDVIRDTGTDGLGGGKITIDIYVNFGNVEVTR